jgi:hypothetical protein
MNNSSPEPNHRGGQPPVDNRPNGRIVYRPEPPHDCQPDSAPLAVPEGTIWECFTCGSEWMAIRDFRGGGEWLIMQRGFRHEAHQPIGRTMVVLVLILVAIGVGLAIIFTSG